MADWQAVSTIHKLRDGNSGQRLQAMDILENNGDFRAYHDLLVITMDEDENNNTRLKAARTLGMISDGELVNQMLPLLKDQDKRLVLLTIAEIHHIVMYAELSKYTARSWARAIKPLLANEDQEIRESARYTLYRIGEYMIGPLIDALENLDDTGRTEAIRVLRELTGKKFKNDPEIWRAWWAEQGKNKGI